MKYLLDTHVVLWAAENSPLLSDKAKAAILDETIEKYVSIVSAWEVAIKLGTKKLTLNGGLSEFFHIIDENGYFTISVEREYLHLIPQLPDHHRDPFDRMLIATAISEEMTLLTADENIHKYKIFVSFCTSSW
jgi:PIN domain nuclease of toxin-antitoxin system